MVRWIHLVVELKTKTFTLKRQLFKTFINIDTALYNIKSALFIMYKFTIICKIWK